MPLLSLITWSAPLLIGRVTPYATEPPPGRSEVVAARQEQHEAASPAAVSPSSVDSARVQSEAIDRVPPRSVAAGVAPSLGTGAGYAGALGLQVALPLTMSATGFQWGPVLALGAEPPMGSVGWDWGSSLGVMAFWGK